MRETLEMEQEQNRHWEMRGYGDMTREGILNELEQKINRASVSTRQHQMA